MRRRPVVADGSTGAFEVETGSFGFFVFEIGRLAVLVGVSDGTGEEEDDRPRRDCLMWSRQRDSSP